MIEAGKILNALKNKNTSIRLLGHQETVLITQYIVALYQKSMDQFREPHNRTLYMRNTSAVSSAKNAITGAGGFSNFPKDEADELVLFDTIQEQVTQAAQKDKLQLIQNYFPHEIITSENLSTFHNHYIKHHRTHALVMKKISFLINEGTLGDSTFECQLSYAPHNQTYTITVPDVSSGYAIHNLLGKSRENEPSTQYDTETSFDLSFSDLEQLENYLKELYRWHKDFKLILSSLFGDTIDEYVGSAKKSVLEIIIGELERAEKYMTTDAFNVFSSMEDNHQVLIATQVGLDFSNHPQKDTVKSLFETIYRELDLKDNKGGDKTFLKDTYQSTLGLNQLRKIMDVLMVYASISKCFNEMGFESIFQAIDELGEVYVKQTIYQFYCSDLIILYRTLHPDTNQPEWKITQIIAGKLGIANPDAVPIVQLMMQHHVVKQKMLNERLGLRLGEQTSRACDIAPTETRALFALNATPLTAKRPSTDQEIDALFASLKTNKTYQQVTEAMEQQGIVSNFETQALTPFATRLKSGIRQTSSDRFYGREPAEKALECITAWVAKIVYQEKTHVSSQSIEASLVRLYSLVSSDNGHDAAGCNRGLWGRAFAVLSTLAESDNNPIRDIVMGHIKEKAEYTFNEFSEAANSSESSMHELYKEHVFVTLGLMPASSAGHQAHLFPRMNDFLKRLATKLKADEVIIKISETLEENFKNFLRDKNDEAIYTLLKHLGFTKETTSEAEKIMLLDKSFRLNSDDSSSPWNINTFRQQVINHLVPELLKLGLLQTEKPGQVCIVTAGGRVTGCFDSKGANTPLESSVSQAPRSIEFVRSNNTIPVTQALNDLSLFSHGRTRREATNQFDIQEIASSKLPSAPSYTAKD